MASSVIYYRTEAQKNEIHLFYIMTKLAKLCEDPQNKLAKLDNDISWRHPYMSTLITHSSLPMKMQNEHVLYYIKLYTNPEYDFNLVRKSIP